MTLTKISDNLFQADSNPYVFTSDDCKIIEDAAKNHRLRRARINIHLNNNDEIHEMLIAFTNESLVLPHKHPDKVESFHIIRGRIRITFFDEDGGESSIKPIELDSEDGPFYYRLYTPTIHKVEPLSEMCILHEITNGPFIADTSSVFPTWA